jgi:peptidoglycan/LPS O-acetylase OafA/YrhL
MTAGGGGLRRFVISRMVRLYPAFWACCTITFLVILAIGGSRFSASTSQYLVNLTMLSEFVGVDSIDGAYWSLFVELRFYALVAVVLAIGRIHQAQGFLVFWLAASIALEIVPNGKLRFILLADYSAYFIAGATCYLIWSKGMSWTRAGLIVLAWALAVVQAVKALPGFESQYATPISGYVVGAIITAFFVAMLLVALKRTGFWGRNRWMLAGVLTYPLYLLHQNIGFMIFNVGYPAVNPHVLLWGTFAGMLAAAYAVHALVEKRVSRPMKNGMNKALDAMQRIPARSA